MKDTLSIIVPVHNVQLYVERCLTSLCEIKNIDVKFILVENGSSDSSYDICKRIAEKDSRVVLLRLDESGVSNARNKALDVCESDYVTFMDADDYINASAFEQAFNCCSAKGPDLYFSPYFKDEKGKKEIVPLDLGKLEFRDEEIFSEIVQKRLGPGIRFLGSVWRVFFKRCLIGNLRFNKQMSYQEDVAFLIRCAIRAKYVVANDKIAYYSYRINNGSANANPKVNNSNRRLDLIGEIEDIARSSGLPLTFALAQRSVAYYAKKCGEVSLCSNVLNRIQAIVNIHNELSQKDVLLCDSSVFGKFFSVYIKLRKNGALSFALILLVVRYLLR